MRCSLNTKTIVLIEHCKTTLLCPDLATKITTIIIIKFVIPFCRRLRMAIGWKARLGDIGHISNIFYVMLREVLIGLGQCFLHLNDWFDLSFADSLTSYPQKDLNYSDFTSKLYIWMRIQKSATCLIIKKLGCGSSFGTPIWWRSCCPSSMLLQPSAWLSPRSAASFSCSSSALLSGTRWLGGPYLEGLI